MWHVAFVVTRRRVEPPGDATVTGVVNDVDGRFVAAGDRQNKRARTPEGRSPWAEAWHECLIILQTRSHASSAVGRLRHPDPTDQRCKVGWLTVQKKTDPKDLGGAPERPHHRCDSDGDR